MVSVFYWIIAGVLLVSADQIAKYFATIKLLGRGTVEVIPGIIDFYYTTNTGAAFSSFSGQRLFLIIAPILMIGVLLFFFARTKKKGFMLNLSVLLIVSGGIGNLIDRIFLGYVIDFINFAFITFPVFNLADIFVTCGGALIIIYMIFFADKEKKDEDNE